jgi:hypothetical protein
MDLNFLYAQHQVAIMRAAGARTAPVRSEFLIAADALAGRIGAFQRSEGAAAACGWVRAAGTGTAPLTGAAA